MKDYWNWMIFSNPPFFLIIKDTLAAEEPFVKPREGCCPEMGNRGPYHDLFLPVNLNKYIHLGLL